MFVSVLDLFKISIGPSSSHTMGPMVAAESFLHILRSGEEQIPGSSRVSRIKCYLYGSLALTGKGHGTSRALILGLAGMTPQILTNEKATGIENQLRDSGLLKPTGLPEIKFEERKDIIFKYKDSLKEHPNGLVIKAFDERGNLHAEETYFSIGGGFVKTKKEINTGQNKLLKADVPFPFKSSKEMLEMAEASNNNIATMMTLNELTFISKEQLDEGIKSIWEVMNKSIKTGLETSGRLPGGLNLRRRAQSIHVKLLEEARTNLIAPHVINDWISVYAIAVNEENAAGGRIVTAPTNGAAGVIPATIRYYFEHVPNAKKELLSEFLLTAAAIGGLIKNNASISGAEVGCQGEIGSAAAMAAAGLCAVLGGTSAQIENSAEIALEHHLGMTCDPIKGLVQAPCIERNGLGAIKAVSAASLALRGDGHHLVSLDSCIKTMKQTGLDMSTKYKETALGGLAVNIIDC